MRLKLIFQIEIQNDNVGKYAEKRWTNAKARKTAKQGENK